MRDNTKAYSQLLAASDAPEELQQLAPDAVWFLLVNPLHKEAERLWEEITTRMRGDGIVFEAHEHSHPDGRTIWIGRKVVDPLLKGLFGQRTGTVAFRTGNRPESSRDE